MVGGPLGKFTLTDGFAKRFGPEMTENNIIGQIDREMGIVEESLYPPLVWILVTAMIAFWVVYVLNYRKNMRKAEGVR